MPSTVDIYPSMAFYPSDHIILLKFLKDKPKLAMVLLFTRPVLQSLGNSNFSIKVSHRFCLMLSRTMYFSLYFLPFQNLCVTWTFSLMSFPTNVFHTFTKTDGCVGSPTSLASVITKHMLGNLFRPQPRLTCDAYKAPTRAFLAFPSSSSFSSPSCSAFLASSSFSSWFKFK
jgi:hypothetical protein